MELYSKQRSASSAIVHIEAGTGPVSGTIRGPFSPYARTLPTTFAISSEGIATVMDPCYWTPKLPFHYRVSVESASGVEAFPWALRRCEYHRASLRLDGQRHVLRAVGPRCDWHDIDLAALRSSGTALYWSGINERLFREASDVGVLLLVNLTQSDCTAEVLRRLNRHPAVHVVVPPTGTDLNHLPPTDLLLASWSTNVSGECQTALRLVPEVELRTSIDTEMKSPTLAVRFVSPTSCDELRHQCDRLQSDLAAAAQFAGYLTVASVPGSNEDIR